MPKGLYAKTAEKLKSAAERTSNIVSGAALGVTSAVSGGVDAVKGVISSTNSNYQMAKSIAVTLATRKDDLVEALIGIFAAFIFKTIVFPLLILFGLVKVFSCFGFSRHKADMS